MLLQRIQVLLVTICQKLAVLLVGILCVFGIAVLVLNREKKGNKSGETYTDSCSATT